MTRDELQALARQQLWRDGVAAEYLLDDCFRQGPDAPWEYGKGQRSWLKTIEDCPPASWVGLEVARQRGKTFCILGWDLQKMGMERNLSTVYLAQTGGNAEAIVASFFREVEADLPPEWGVRIKDGALVVESTGSELAFFGTDNKQYRRRRGRKARIVILDEAAFYDDLEDVEQVYVPQLQTTGGIGIYVSSPPISPAHPWTKRMRSLRAAKRYVTDTFWSNPRINHENVIQGEMERTGMTRDELFKSTAWRREYLAETVAEESRLAMSAWNDALRDKVVGDWERPAFWDGYQAHDPGITGDPHASLFAWHDPATNRLVIEDEMELRSAATTISAWAAAIKAKEVALYGAKAWDGTSMGARDWAQEFGVLPEFLQRSISDAAPRQPYLRVGDNAQGLCRDLSGDYGLAVFPTPKHEKAIEVDRANTLLAQGRILIHRRCVRLVEQLYSTVWDRNRSKWEHTDKDHGDLVDCLTYLVRNVRWHRDCRPPPRVEVFDLPQHMKPKTGGLSALKGAFK